MLKKQLKSLKRRVLVHTIQTEQDFSSTCSFREMLANVESITCMKSQNIWAIRCRDLAKKLSKLPLPLLPSNVQYKQEASHFNRKLSHIGELPYILVDVVLFTMTDFPEESTLWSKPK